MFNEHLCPVFRALADPRRLGYVEALLDDDVRFGDLAEISPLSQPTVIHHLKVLEECGLLRSRKEGRVRLYTLRPEGLRSAYDWIERIVWKAYGATPGSPLYVPRPPRS
ncbi:MAG TPA: metalloregulator ArsR/SmtB family transcription factor [Steroidobacteraceae bacterium]|nr:metalloregulator ArsR/SmtB family transcription factor [Steroidobacteraceae bacterium]